MSALFEPLQLGAIELPNRFVMAPLTRARAGMEAVPNDLMAAYYAQRSSAGNRSSSGMSTPSLATLLVMRPRGRNSSFR